VEQFPLTANRPAPPGSFYPADRSQSDGRALRPGLWLDDGFFLAVVPVVILFFILQKEFIGGLTAGAVKG